MNILVLEDRGSVSHYMEKALQEPGHKILSSFNVNDARSNWELGKIDCLIVDLNMAPNGLNPEEVKDTHDGLLTGWIWLREYVYKNNPEMRKRTIIYTDYMDALVDNVSEEQLDGIHLVPKRGSTRPAKQILKRVEEIDLMGRRD